MKKSMIALFSVMALFMGALAFADEVPNLPVTLTNGVHLKQGFIIPWEKPESGFMNMTTATIAQTEPYAPFGAWNALWDGWTLDAAWSYDAGTSNVGLMIGRHFGTLGKYLPISYPFADKIDITLYPAGFTVANIDSKPDFSGATGAAIIKFDVAF